jgi:hypothetical protein
MKNKTDQIQWGKFAGLASQWAIVLTILIFLGKYMDQSWKGYRPFFYGFYLHYLLYFHCSKSLEIPNSNQKSK